MRVQSLAQRQIAGYTPFDSQSEQSLTFWHNRGTSPILPSQITRQLTRPSHPEQTERRTIDKAVNEGTFSQAGRAVGHALGQDHFTERSG